jgi:hypothetical protein
MLHDPASQVRVVGLGNQLHSTIGRSNDHGSLLIGRSCIGTASDLIGMCLAPASSSGDLL